MGSCRIPLTQLFSLHGKTAIVTGGTGGLGSEMTLALVGENLSRPLLCALQLLGLLMNQNWSWNSTGGGRCRYCFYSATIWSVRSNLAKIDSWDWQKHNGFRMWSVRQRFPPNNNPWNLEVWCGSRHLVKLCRSKQKRENWDYNGRRHWLGMDSSSLKPLNFDL
jgi:hypothetical protein